MVRGLDGIRAWGGEISSGALGLSPADEVPA
jgi:hypothetical protein